MHQPQVWRSLCFGQEALLIDSSKSSRNVIEDLGKNESTYMCYDDDASSVGLFISLIYEPQMTSLTFDNMSVALRMADK